MDARVKLLCTLVFILCLNLNPMGAWPTYILFLTLVLAEHILSRLSIKTVLLRSLISIPFVLAALPLLITGSEPRFPVIFDDKSWLNISQPGLIKFLSIAVKSWMSIYSAILLSSTTKYGDLLNAFRQLGIPKVIVAILSLMWRYLSIMIDEAMNLMRARNSRSGSTRNKQISKGSLVWRAKVTGRMAGNLFLRSLERSERVYAAMTSRGYNGEQIQARVHPLSSLDFVIMLGISLLCVIFLVTAFYMNYGSF